MFTKDFGLSGQIQRAAVSVMANIAEGFERNRPGEFHQFLSVAKGSCAEVRSHLYAAYDAGYIDKDQLTDILSHGLTLRKLDGLSGVSESRLQAEKPFLSRTIVPS
jgi:four helix bundle protein